MFNRITEEEKGRLTMVTLYISLGIIVVGAILSVIYR
jgi:hypothetical protein